MSKKFQVYAQVRATRQLAGDIVTELQSKGDFMTFEWREWDKIEQMLNTLECRLEHMNLKEDRTNA